MRKLEKNGSRTRRLKLPTVAGWRQRSTIALVRSRAVRSRISCSGRKAICRKEVRFENNENWVQTFGAYRSQRYRHAAFRYRETDRHLARPTSRRALFGKLTQLPKKGKSVTGPRSNRLVC